MIFAYGPSLGLLPDFFRRHSMFLKSSVRTFYFLLSSGDFYFLSTIRECKLVSFLESTRGLSPTGIFIEITRFVVRGRFPGSNLRGGNKHVPTVRVLFPRCCSSSRVIGVYYTTIMPASLYTWVDLNLDSSDLSRNRFSVTYDRAISSYTE